MKRSLLIILIILIGNIVFAGDANKTEDKGNSKLIFGKIIDKKSGEEIAGAAVKIDDKIIYTDLNGNFSASISTKQTQAIVTSISYNDTNVNIDPFSYSKIVVELESK
ncbi:MAG: hypothetical protein A3F72_15825 [Bacteroidetes bacterium RIFCSPLOWO2_12_FULL_35_15]|nr:MAG: hypothetical protein A3F72_15825 [Bacteroidetes bacterium RIFCSPLOWO2_12_FULL_35_15]